MTDETTTEQLAEIEGQAADYTPPEGWRVLQVGEVIETGDKWVRPDDREAFTACRIGQQVHGRMRYIRRMEQQPEQQPEPEPEPEDCGFEGKILREQPQPVQIREGRWRTRGGDIRNIIPTPAERSESGRCLWRDAYYYQTWYPSGHYSLNGEHPLDLWEYLGPIQPEPEQAITTDDVAAEALAGVWDQAKAERQIAELRSEVSYVQRLLGTERRRVTQLEELVTSLRTINEAQEKAFEAAGKENTALQTQLEAVKAESAKRLETIQELRSEVSHVQGLLGDERRRFTELETLASDLRAVNAATEKAVNSTYRDKADLQHRLDTVAAEWALQAETIRGLESLLEAVKAELVQASKDRHALQVELDAREQVPADSPELRQLRADLAEVAHDRDTYRHAHELLLKDANTVHERTKAMTVEAIAEWLEPVRLVDSPNLANETLQHLPQIMRSLAGLNDEEIE